MASLVLSNASLRAPQGQWWIPEKKNRLFSAQGNNSSGFLQFLFMGELFAFTSPNTKITLLGEIQKYVMYLLAIGK
jgi:hypothetical protein